MKLNIACGANVFPDWVNCDRVDMEEAYFRHIRGLDVSQMIGWPEHQKKEVRWLEEGRLHFFQHDLRKGFPMYPDGSVEAIYLGQMIEHLNPVYEAPKFLKECHRLLKPGGRIRITTPDLGKLLNAYLGKEMGDFESEQPEFYKGASPEMQLCYLMYGASGPGCTWDAYDGHFVCYDTTSLCHLLRLAGFAAWNATTMDPIDVFADCVDMGMSHSMAVEAVK